MYKYIDFIHLLIRLYFLLLLLEFVCCKPNFIASTNLINASSLKKLLEGKDKNFKLLDFRPSREIEFTGYIGGSIIVPDSLTLDILQDHQHSIQKDLYYDEKDDRDKIVILISGKQNLLEAYQKLVALGYLEQNASVKAFIDGIEL